jgi:hypothetical protein
MEKALPKPVRLLIRQTAYQQLMDKVVAQTLPDEMTAYSLASETITERLFTDDEPVTKRLDNVAEFRFISQAKEVIEFLSVMLGTFKALKQIKAAMEAHSSSPSPITFGEQWTLELVQAGLRRDKADKIVSHFLHDLEGVLVEEQNDSQD